MVRWDNSYDEAFKNLVVRQVEMLCLGMSTLPAKAKMTHCIP
jgi:hypothetical protein